MNQQITVAVLLPCYNEGVSIGKTIEAFRAALPAAAIYVYDNNSTDNTAEVARSFGAIVKKETQQGKGAVVRRMFRDIQADFYIMADGDNTYDAALAQKMIDHAQQGPFDLVNCIRQETDRGAYRGGHRLGNQLITGAVRWIFGARVDDMLSGYKVFSRRFVKSFPILTTGFDIETEITIHALELALPIAHVDGDYRPRAEGSVSKLRTYHDGWRILRLILRLLRHERPLFFFGSFASFAFIVAIALFIPVFSTYLQTGQVPRLPTALLATGIVLVGALSLTTGVVLDTVTRGRREMRLLAYLALNAL